MITCSFGCYHQIKIRFAGGKASPGRVAVSMFRTEKYSDLYFLPQLHEEKILHQLYQFERKNEIFRILIWQYLGILTTVKHDINIR